MMRRDVVVSGLVLAVAAGVEAGTIVRVGTGANTAELLPVVDLFRADVSLGGANNGAGGGPFTTGRREVNWDAPGLDAFQSPNLMPPDFFNRVSLRGLVCSTPGEGLLVSRRNANDPNDPLLRFGDIDASYNGAFTVFSAQRLFAARGSTVTELEWFVPIEPSRPATINGFGVVFTDVDRADATVVEFLGADGTVFHREAAPVRDRGLSFVGVTFDDRRIWAVRITCGERAMAAGVPDGAQGDIVAMDDFLYGEPQAVVCGADFNGDGVVDSDDFFDFLNAFFAGDASADFNGDGVVDTDDFYDFLNALLTGC